MFTNKYVKSIIMTVRDFNAVHNICCSMLTSIQNTRSCTGKPLTVNTVRDLMVQLGS